MELVNKKDRNGQRALLGVLLWTVFAAGLLVQASSPRLRIRDNAFVIPSSLISGTKEVRPDQIVARERRMQALSGILTLSGALGLAFYYRRVFIGPRSPQN